MSKTLTKAQLEAQVATLAAQLAAVTLAGSTGAAAPAAAEPSFRERMAEKAKQPVVAIDLTVCTSDLAYALHSECRKAYRVTISKSGKLYFHGAKNEVLGSRDAKSPELALRTLRKDRVPNGVTLR
jgi:hypothetical protein